jgi:DNA-binding CsgD family transcriptional regulator
MSRQTEISDSLPVSPISCVKAIQSGQIQAKSLPKENRQICVEYLTSEGYSSGTIAEIMKVDTRTIRRDKERIRHVNAINLDAAFTSKHVGLLMQGSQHVIENLIRIAKDKDCPYFVKVNSFKGIWAILKELTQLLQSIGYLPTQSLLPISESEGETYPMPSLDDLIGELDSLKTSFEQAGIIDENTAQDIAKLEDAVSRLTVSKKIKHVQSKIVEAKKND